MYKGTTITMEWIETLVPPFDAPIMQVSGVCLNENGDILVVKKKDKWSLPGGHPENEETPAQTLQREIMEEAGIRIDEFKLLGAIRVTHPNNPKEKGGETYYQLRYYAKASKLLSIKPDPATGYTFERKFVKPEEFIEYTKWGIVGETIIKKAVDIHESAEGGAIER